VKEYLTEKLPGEGVPDDEAVKQVRRLSAFGVLFATSALMFPACWYYWGFQLGWMALAFSMGAIVLASAMYFFVYWFWSEYPSCYEIRRAKRFPLLTSQALGYFAAIAVWVVYMFSVPQLKLLPNSFIWTSILTVGLGYGGLVLLQKINANILRI
jgi:hypothetical protein